MRVVQYSPPVPESDLVIVDHDVLPFFYDQYHQHKEMQVTYIIKGEGTLIVGKYNQPFKAGDIYILGSRQPHVFKSSPHYHGDPEGSNCEAIQVYFDIGGLPRLFLALPEMEEFNRFVEFSSGGLQVPAKYEARVGEMIRELYGKSRVERLIRIIELFVSFEREVTEWKSLSNGFMEHRHMDNLDGTRINDVFKFTREHYMENISLTKIAEVANITPNAFCKFFKKHTRKTYNSFLNEVRIKEACRMMISNRYTSISNIAYTTGFNSPTNFNRVFRRTVGMSPGDYLREYKTKYA